jgi:hypothetical protein
MERLSFTGFLNWTFSLFSHGLLMHKMSNNFVVFSAAAATGREKCN